MEYDAKDDVFRVRWHGFGAQKDTWEPPAHLPFNHMERFFRRTKSRLPSHLLAFRQ